MKPNGTSSAVQGRRGCLVSLLTPVLAASLLAGCGGGHAAAGGGGGDPATVTGLVVKGPIGSSTVTAYPLDPAMNRGAALTSGPTQPDGTFTLKIPAHNGPLEIVAFAGNYPEEAVGVPVQLTHELTFVIPAYQSGSSVTVTVSPISSIARSLAKAAIGRGSSLTDAVSTAWTHVNAHFGALDWRTVVPTNLTPSMPTTVTMSDATKAGLILAGISQAARTMAEASTLSPGTSVTGGTLSGAGADDATDGVLDGMAFGSALVQGSVPLTSYTFRRVLGQAIVKFIGTSYNKTQLVAADVTSLANALAADSDPYLFCPNQTAAPSCAGGSLQLQPPTITFLSPPTFVNTTTVTLQVQATDPLASVTAVYAQTVSGRQITGTFAGGVWTLSNIPLVEGPNLIFVWGVDAAGTGSIANATKITVTRDTIPPAPYVNTTATAYYDERTMTLASGAVPPVYQFPGSASKVSPFLAGGVWKTATRLGWNTRPTPTDLEGANPDNVPFIQIALPMSPSWSPTAAGTFSLTIGNTVVTGDLMPWKSPASTATTEYYDVPLSSNIAPTLATTTTAPITVAVSVQFADAAGNTGGTSITLPPFHVIGPLVFVAEDSAYATYDDPKSTFPYKLANNTYATLFDPASGSFYAGQVRLLRYIITNPAPSNVALRTDITQSPSGSWLLTETWGGTRTRLTTRNPVSTSNCLCLWPPCAFTPAVIPSMDGFAFSDCYETFDTCAPTPESQSVPPTAANISGWYTHVAGDTVTSVACKPKLWYAGAQTAAVADVTAQAFNGPSLTAGEVMPAATMGSYSVVPAASGGTPGTLVVYVTRPVTAPRITTFGTWNNFTTANRYEANKGYVFIPDDYTVSSSYVWWYYPGWVGEAAAYQEIGFLSAAAESIAASLTLTTQGISGSSLIGETASASPLAVSRSLPTH